MKNNVFPGPDASPFPKPSPQRPSIASVVEIRPDALDVKGREASGDVVVVERPVWNVHLVESGVEDVDSPASKVRRKDQPLAVDFANRSAFLDGARSGLGFCELSTLITA